jgi:NAD-dependent dihydropyrimidine dehydrogenase PreA subunit
VLQRWYRRRQEAFGRRQAPPGQAAGSPARPVIRALVWARRASRSGSSGCSSISWSRPRSAARLEADVRPAITAGRGLPARRPVRGGDDASCRPRRSTKTCSGPWGLALTVAVGRVFCGWICPFGTLHHFFAWIFPSRYVKGGRRVEQNKTHPVRQSIKYYLISRPCWRRSPGSAIGGPASTPSASRCGRSGSASSRRCSTPRARATVAYESGSPGLQRTTADARRTSFCQSTCGRNKQFYYHQTWLIVTLLVAILFMNRFVPRFWCRVLCPLGAFLGVLSRFALFGMEKDHAKCTDCNLCLVHCQGADSPSGRREVAQDECHMCMNCETACPEDVIKFRFLPRPVSSSRRSGPGRRTALASAAAGAALVPARASRT